MSAAAPAGLHADLAFVRDVLAGEADAVRSFVERMRCIPRVQRIRNEKLGRPLAPEDLADLAQETFSVVWGKLAEFRGEAALETWVHHFCVLSLLNHVRRKTRESRRREREELVGEAPSRPGARTFASDLDLVHEALDGLPPDEREVIRLKQLCGRSFTEISALLGISANTAKTRYYRGLGVLRDTLGKAFGEESS